MGLLWMGKRETIEAFFLWVMGGEVGLRDWRDGFEWSLRLSQRFGREPAMDFQTFLRLNERAANRHLLL
jgi:hypothetical protein